MMRWSFFCRVHKFACVRNKKIIIVFIYFVVIGIYFIICKINNVCWQLSVVVGYVGRAGIEREFFIVIAFVVFCGWSGRSWLE